MGHYLFQYLQVFCCLGLFEQLYIWVFTKFSLIRYCRTPIIRTLVVRIANYPDRLGPSGKFIENSTKESCLEIIGYRIKYSTVLWLIELQFRRGRKV